MTIFWQQQQKLFERNPKGARFYSMLIRYGYVFLTNIGKLAMYESMKILILGNSSPNSYFKRFTLIY